jgi:hypothetical protein
MTTQNSHQAYGLGVKCKHGQVVELSWSSDTTLSSMVHLSIREAGVLKDVVNVPLILLVGLVESARYQVNLQQGQQKE